MKRLKSVKNYDDTDIKTALAKKADSADVTKEISDKIAEVVSDAPESFDTLKEISDWISGHENDASAMNSAIKDNKSAIATLQTDKADKTEIPTELPANGGNSATVNGHTVKSDVPENAVFTDTVYDDAEIQKRISDNGYGTTAGGKNLLKPMGFNATTYVGGAACTQNEDGTVTIKGTVTSAWHKLIIGTCKLEAGNYTFSSKYSFGSGLIFIETPTEDPISAEHFSFTITKSTNFYIQLSLNVGEYDCTIYPQIEKGLIATEYEPYFPSNKMLAEENTKQSIEMMDIKMLGWSVPRECPVQNEIDGNQFIQKVERVELSTLDWWYQSQYTRFNTSIVTDMAHPSGTRIDDNLYIYGYTTISNGLDISNIPDKSVYSTENLEICIHDSAYTDITAFKSVMQGKYLYYELATPITTMIDGNEIGETVSDVRKETTVNIFKPTSQTATQKGITCTNNGDGTYTISGTSTAQVTFQLAVNVKVPTSCILTGCKGGSPTTYMFGIYDGTNYFEVYDVDNAKEIEAKTYKYAYIVVRSGVTLPDNVIISPMITTNLSATYKDFVSYTGDTGSLNGDVADLRSDVDGLKNETKAAINDTSITSTTETWSAKKINDSLADTFNTRIVLSLSRGVDVSTQSAPLNGATGAYLYWSSMAGQDKYTIGMILYVNSGWSIIPLKESDQKTTISLSISANTLTMTRSSSGFPCAGGVIALGTDI